MEVRKEIFLFHCKNLVKLNIRMRTLLGWTQEYLDVRFVRLGWKQLCDKHMRYPENTGLEDFMISGSRIKWSYLNIQLHLRVRVGFAQQLITITARKHIVFKLHDVLYLSSKCVHKIWVSFTAFLSLGSVKLCTDWNGLDLHCIEMK